MGLFRMRQLFVIRHCESVANSKDLISGQTDVPVGDCIINMQEYAKTQFKNLLILSSPLSRCKETAEKLKIYLPMLMKDIVIDNNLIERNMGIFEGEKREVLVQRYPDYFTKGRFIHHKTPPEGETFDSFYERIRSFSSTLYSILDKNDVIICSHNQTLKLLYAIMKNVPLEELWYGKDFKSGVFEEIRM